MNFFNLTYVVAMIVAILDAVTCEAEPDPSPPEETIPWLVQAATLVCPLPIIRPWPVMLRTR